MLRDKLTILVCSCDKYSDLWNPFFTLLHKYWNPLDVRILLNTESLDFSFDGLEIECVHSPGENRYGQRMLNALSQVKTEYTLLLMDDFFLRKSVDHEMIDQIVDWMEADRHIVCFNFEATTAYADWECNKYPGFRRLPPGNKFMLNMQAAVWRTEGLQKYWRPDISPWEWEVCCNLLTTKWPRDKFYCTIDSSILHMDYGHHKPGDLWGVVQGKWFLKDVQPFFEDEGISIDFSKRGEFAEEQAMPYFKSLNTLKEQFSLVYRSLGVVSTIRYCFFRVRCKLAQKVGKKVDINYFAYLREKEHRKFCTREVLEG